MGKKPAEAVAVLSPAVAERNPKTRLVADATQRLRELILSQPPETHLGSLTAVAERLGVGIVTVQQAARVLEHEGLLSVKRGPGGGYYGARPDEAALQRAFATYMRVHNVGYREAFEMAVLLDCDIVQAAAGSNAPGLEEKIDALAAQLEHCATAQENIQFEVDLRDTLLQIVERPLLELLATVAMQWYQASAEAERFLDQVGASEWREGRRRMLRAIRERDPELAFFEAQRYRRTVLDWIYGGQNNHAEQP